MTIVGDIAQGDTELVLMDTVFNVGASFQDDTDPKNIIPLTPASLSLEVTDVSGRLVLSDVYLPATQRTPNPPRILNPSTGKYAFPFGLDNGSTDPLKTNKTNQCLEYLFTWRAAAVASVKAYATIAPLKWTSVASGTPGNFITVQYVDPGLPSQPLSVTRNGPAIVVNLATGPGGLITTTAADVVALVPTLATVVEIVTVDVDSGSLPPDLLPATPATPLANGVDADNESVVCVSVKVITHRLCALINKFRLLIDKTHKFVSSDPNDPCYLGYSNGQLWQYLTSGMQIINSYQPYGTFNFYNFPYENYDFILMETSLLAGMMSQSMFSIDTDIPQWNDQGNAFVITHYQQLASYINWLSQRLNTLIPQFKLHFVNSGSLHIEAGPNYRLAQLIQAAPNGALFRNMFTKVV
jgi:hypothetical protein